MAEGELRGREKQVLIELLKDGRIPDKHVAKKIGTTQPTVTRIRQKLERENIIKRYRAIVDYGKVGIAVVVITFWTWSDYSKQEERRKFMDILKQKPEVMFLSRGEGIEGRTTVIISAHCNFGEYESFIREVRSMGGTNISRVIQFITSPGFYKQYDSTDASVAALSKTVEEKK